MFIRRIPRIMSSATCTYTSRPAIDIIFPRISGPVYVHGIRTSTPMMSRNHHVDGSIKSGEESGPGDKVESKLRREESGEKDKSGNGVDRGEKANSNKGERKGNEKVEMKKKTIAEMDEELRAKMEGREGAAGVSYEGGKPVTDGFGRGVKSNMFRVI